MLKKKDLYGGGNDGGDFGADSSGGESRQDGLASLPALLSLARNCTQYFEGLWHWFLREMTPKWDVLECVQHHAFQALPLVTFSCVWGVGGALPTHFKKQFSDWFLNCELASGCFPPSSGAEAGGSVSIFDLVPEIVAVRLAPASTMLLGKQRGAAGGSDSNLAQPFESISEEGTHVEICFSSWEAQIEEYCENPNGSEQNFRPGEMSALSKYRFKYLSVDQLRHPLFQTFGGEETANVQYTSRTSRCPS